MPINEKGAVPFGATACALPGSTETLTKLRALVIEELLPPHPPDNSNTATDTAAPAKLRR